jgi:hypothetical protein
MLMSFVFSSCDFVDRPFSIWTNETIHEVTRTNTNQGLMSCGFATELFVLMLYRSSLHNNSRRNNTNRVESEVFQFVLVRVTSWIVRVFIDKRNDPRSHTN